MKTLSILSLSLMLSVVSIAQDEVKITTDIKALDTAGMIEATNKITVVNLSSPRESLKVFLFNLTKENYNPELASQIFNKKDVPRATDRVQMADHLKRFLDGKGVIIDLNAVSNNPKYKDSTNLDKHEYILTPRFSEIYLEKVGRVWYLSSSSAKAIPDIFANAFPFGSDQLIMHLPKWSETELLGLQIWQFIAIMLVVVLSIVLNKALKWLLELVFFSVLFRKSKGKVKTERISRPIGYAIVILFVDYFEAILMLPVELAYYLTVLLSILAPIFITISVYSLMDILGLYLKKLSEKTESTLDDQLVPIATKALKVFVIIIGIIWILSNLTINILPFVAGLSIGGIAFALAAQDTIKNFFGSVMIFIDKPFQVGQWISADGIDGTVEEVGIRSTRIRTFRNSLLYIPNGQLADTTIDNHGLRAYRRFFTYLTIAYDTPPALIELFIEGLRKIVDKHPHTVKDDYHVYMNNMSSHSLDIMFYIFFEAKSWGLELAYRHEVLMSIMRLAEKLGVNFAFPTQTVQIQELPGQKSLMPEYEPIEKLVGKMDDFFSQEKK